MSYVEEEIIKEFREFIEDDNLKMLEFKYDEYINKTEFDFKIQWDYIFSKSYLHACLKKRIDISNWLKEKIYSNLPDYVKIAIRHTLNYGSYILRK